MGIRVPRSLPVTGRREKPLKDEMTWEERVVPRVDKRGGDV